MEKLTQEAWNALTPEEQDLRKDEKPDVDPGKGQEPTIDELKNQLADTNKRIAAMEDKHGKERDGLLYDLQNERRNRQELEGKIKESSSTEKGDPLEGKADDDILSVADLKKLRKKDAETLKNQRINDLKERAADRMDMDEERMQVRTASKSDKYPVPYDEALEAFGELAKKDPRIWDEINREALKPGGRPAEKMYRIALTEHPSLAGKSKATEREKIIAELEKAGKIPKRTTGGGSGKGELDLENMSEEEILKAVDENPEAVDRALGKK